MAENNNRFFIKFLFTVLFVALLALPAWISHKNKAQSRAVTVDTSSALKNHGFYLTDASRESEIDFIHHSPELDPLFDPILPQIASMGASVSVCDFDNDGWNDLYVTNSKFGYGNSLYHNQKDGNFKDVAPETGLSDLNIKGEGVCMGSVWGDYNNDGFEDVFVYRWGKPELFRNEAGKKFTRVTENSGLPAWLNANTAIWFDYNADGLIDLFIGGYFPETVDLWHLKNTRVLTESFEYSQNGGRNFLMKNNGNGTFSDVSVEAGLVTTRWTLAAGAADINRDGFPELVVANDFGIDEFYLNSKGVFTEQSNSTMIGFAPKSGMNVSFADVENSGRLGIYISNITEEGILIQGNNFWTPVNRNGRIVYENSARRLGIEFGGWSYCAQFGDLNNDGYQDLYVANGYISGKKGTDYWYDYSRVTGGNASIISDIKNWPAMNGRTHAGYQQNKIWINQGGEYFTDVANEVAEKENYDSRAVAFADLWNRGVLDVIVANENNRLVVYRNHTDPHNNWISFELKSKNQNTSAIGAIIDLYNNGKMQSQVITGGIGFCSQNQRRLHFGLGKSEKADSAVITWPDGTIETVKNPPVNTIHKISSPNE